MILFRKLTGSKHLSPTRGDGIFPNGNTCFQDSIEWSDFISINLLHLVNQAAYIKFSKAKTNFTCTAD